MKKQTYEYLEHTADAGMRVWGDSVDLLFTNAAMGLFGMMAVIDSIDETVSMDIEVRADSIEMLLVAWLDELIYQHEVEELFFKRVEILSINSEELFARVHGEPTNFDKHIVYTEIKAVTYHQLYVREIENGVWEAQVIFDL
ncbi:protein archease [Candidatus Poribacteria bacterium]|nr:MAG: protein archease [Candidatus Poribacteria bacterium]